MRDKIIKAFFDSTPIISKEAENKNKKIISSLNTYGCNVVQTVMGIDLSYVENFGNKAANNIYTSKITDIKEADIVVCEVSDITMSLCFEIFEAIKLRKPVLALYEQKKFKKSEEYLLNNTSDYLNLHEYNENNLESIIETFIKSSRKKVSSSRFTVRLSTELSEYIDTLKTKYNCTSKNDTIISLLEDLKQRTTF